MKLLCSKLRYLLFLVAGILPLYALSVYAEGIKIGVVNTEKILRESTPALDAQQRIDREFIPRDAEIKEMAQQAKELQEKLEKKGAAMNE
ncbi:MAG: OmpH family outer membrane protein, partial [Nitrosomonas sp.]|nr:OmpH family outer membrane protein [Nitrosomonas sp.]